MGFKVLGNKSHSVRYVSYLYYVKIETLVIKKEVGILNVSWEWKFDQVKVFKS